MYGLFDPSGKTLWLSVDHRRLRPVDDMVLLSCVVGDSVLCSIKLDARRLLVNVRLVLDSICLFHVSMMRPCNSLKEFTTS